MLGALGMDMSGNSNSNNLNAGVLGGGGGGGDIWSTNAFSSYESPLKDLLDRQNYTVEDLLQEDELLQELRGCHDVLIAYLSTEAAVTKLVQYVIQPPPLPLPVVVAAAASSPPESLTTNASISTTGTSNANHSSNIDANKKPGEWLVRHLLEAQQSLPSMMEEEHDPNHASSTATSLPSLLLRQIRFPYMACEIICCEIPILIQTLVDGTCQFTPPLVPTCLHPNNNNINSNNISDDENHCNNNPVVVVEPPIVVDSDPIVLVVVPTNPTSTTITTSSTASSSSPVASTTTLITDEIITSGSQGDMVEVMAHTNTNNHYHNESKRCEFRFSFHEFRCSFHGTHNQ